MTSARGIDEVAVGDPPGDGTIGFGCPLSWNTDGSSSGNIGRARGLLDPIRTWPRPRGEGRLCWPRRSMGVESGGAADVQDHGGDTLGNRLRAHTRLPERPRRP